MKLSAGTLAVVAVALAACSQSDTMPPSEPSSATSSAVGSPAESALDRVIAFENPAECLPTPVLDSLLDQLTPSDETGQLTAIEDVVLPTIAGAEFGQPQMTSNPDGYQIDVPLASMWHGLRLTGISRWWAPESDFQGFALHFSNDREEVRRVVNSLGLMVPPEGHRETAGELPTYIWVDSEKGEPSFNCST